VSWVIIFWMTLPSGEEHQHRMHLFTTRASCEQWAGDMRQAMHITRYQCAPDTAGRDILVRNTQPTEGSRSTQ
jgi:hypothetical protein